MKLKNNKSALKRIKIKKTLLYRKKAYKNHLLRKKTSKRLRNLSKSQVIDNSNKKSFLNLIPYKK
jgi:large subunit ribosomal protein L35